MSWLSSAILLVLASQLNAFRFEDTGYYARREADPTNRLALAMIGASTYPALVEFYIADGSKATNMFVLLSIPPENCDHTVESCPRNSEKFTVLSKNDTHFFATANLTNNANLNRACEEGDWNRVSFVDYAGHLDSPIKFATLQVWYKCGVVNENDAQRIRVEPKFREPNWMFFGICVVIFLLIIAVVIAYLYQSDIREWYISRFQRLDQGPADAQNPPQVQNDAQAAQADRIDAVAVFQGPPVIQDDDENQHAIQMVDLSQRNDAVDENSPSVSEEGGIDNQGMDTPSSGDSLKDPLIE